MTQETNDVVGRLGRAARFCENAGAIAAIEEAIPVIQSQSARIAELEEGLNAIMDRAPERDVKWAGMTARDIAISLTKDSTSG